MLRLHLLFHQLLLASFIACAASATAQPSIPPKNFPALYDYYFPKHAGDVRSDYRKFFDWYFTKEARNWKTNDRTGIFSRALRGDPAAVHLFFHSPDRDQAGEYSEGWVYRCPFLLIYLGDERFATLLEKESAGTRESIGWNLETMIDWRRHSFPKTRGLYVARKIRASPDLVAQKQSPACAPISLTPREEIKLRQALAAQSRYHDVSLTHARRLIPGTRGRAFVYVWSRYSDEDLAALAEFIRQTLNRPTPIQFPTRS